MALIKKFQPGGTTPDLNDALTRELAKFKLKPEIESQVRDQVGKIRDFLAQGEGRELIVDDVTGQWEIKGPGAEQFKGSMDTIKSGFLTGRMRPKTVEQMRNIAATIYGSATKKQTPEVTPEVTKDKVTLPTDFNAALLDLYGGEGNLELALADVVNDDEKTKGFLSQAFKKVAQNYIDAASKNSGEFDYSDLQAAQDIINNQNLDVLSTAQKYKWDVGHMFLKPEQKKAQEEVKAAEQVGVDKQNRIKSLVDSGLPQTTAQKIVELGYSDYQFPQLKIGGRDMLPAFNEYLKERKARLFAKDGKHFVLDQNLNPIQETGESFDPFHRYSGLAFTQDDNGLKFITPNFDLGTLEGKQLEIQGLNPNMKAYAFDKLGRIDILNNRGVKVASYKKQPDGTYRSATGQSFSSKAIKGLGDLKLQIDSYKVEELFPEFRAVRGGTSHVTTAIDLLEDNLRLENAEHADAHKEAFQHLMYMLQDNRLDYNPELREKAKKVLVEYYKRLHPQTQTMKNGGVLFAKKGAFAEYNEKFGKSNTVNPHQTKPMKDITGTWKGMSTEDRIGSGASVAATAASLAPGWVGVGGATASFGIDLVRDLKDGKMDNLGTHLLNAAFVPLSFFGLGGVKAALKVGKASLQTAKAMDATADFSKLAQTAVKSISATDDVAKASLETVENFTKANKEIQTLADLKKAAETATDLKPGVELLEQALVSTIKTAPSTVAPILQKIGKGALNTAKIATGLSAAGSAYEIGKTGITEGLEYTRPEDLRSVVMGAVTGRNYFKNKKIMKAIESQTLRSEGTSASTKIKIGDETTTVKGEIHNPKIEEINRFNPLKKNFRPIRSEKKLAEQNAKEMEKFRESLNEALKDSKITPEQIKKIKPEDVLKSIEQKGSPLYMLGDTPVGSDQKAYDIAKKAGFPVKPEPPKVEKISEPIKTSKIEVDLKNLPKLSESGKAKDIDKLKKLQRLRNVKRKKIEKKQENVPVNTSSKPREGVNKAPKGRKSTADSTSQTRLQFPKPKIEKKQSGGILKLSSGRTVTSKQSIIPSKESIRDFIKREFDFTTLGNFAMYADTLATNKKSAKFQKRAADEGIVKLPGVSPLKIKASSIYTPQAQKMAGDIQSRVGRMAVATSDTSKADALRLEGMTKGNEMISKGQQLDQQRLDAVEAQQLAANAQAQQQNLQIGAQNKTSYAQAAQKISLIDANEAAAKGVAFQTLIHGEKQNRSGKEYNYWMGKAEEYRNNPELKSAVDLLQTHENSLNKLKADYEAKRTSSGGTLPEFEDSQVYKNWLTIRNSRKADLDKLYKPLEQMMQKASGAYNKYVIGMKSGGSLTKAERSELQRENAEYKMKMKELELFYKSIMHNNQMLQKALIKVFK